ncbi:MAG: hypothetical protein R3F30_03865 [Planctomycetota bacterium]
MFTKITYFGLGIMMIAMFWWARAAAFPALVTALGGFGIVFFLLGLKGAINGDFTTLIEYWYVKVVAVLVLLYGIRLAKHQHIALVQSGRYQSRRRPPSRGGRDPGAAKAAP